MTEIEISKGQYHLNSAMERWCEESLGPRAYSKDNLRDDGDLKNLWCKESMFGNTTFSFIRDTDATMFSLRWV